jgi:hypothetical protein
VDPSALIFVALAVAWAVYLIPKALEHHDEGARTRTVERFSARLRVLGRREPVNRRKARLVPASGSPSSDPKRLSERRKSSHPGSLDDKPQLTPAQVRARRKTAARAAKRRLRVVTLLLLANAVVAVLAYLQVFAWVWCSVPVGVLAVWLVACRLMVKRERAELPQGRIQGRIPAELPADKPGDQTGEIARVDASLLGDEQDDPGSAQRDPDSWDPVSVPLPTYVSKPVATRSVSTIDLDSTGVWSSGHNASDSKLAREAEAAERTDATTSTERRAFGA